MDSLPRAGSPFSKSLHFDHVAPMSLLVDVVSVLATLSFLGLVFGPAPDIYRIHKTQSTGVGVLPIIPLASLFLCAWIWTIYAYLSNNFFPLFACNALGIVLSTVYNAVYYRFTKDRAYAHKIYAYFGVASLIPTVYAIVGALGYTNQSRESVKNVLGYVGNVVVFVFFASPFENISQVFKYKSGVFIPITIVVASFTNSVLWLLYSLLVTDWLIFVPNVSAFAIGAVQIALYVYFLPSKNPIDLADVDAPSLAADKAVLEYGRLTSPTESQA